MNKKRSFFERLSGSVSVGDDEFEDEFEARAPARTPQTRTTASEASAPASRESVQSAGELPVDVYQTPSEIVIRTFVAGVRPDELNVSIRRDMVVIEGSREERSSIAAADYFNQELFWGSFARTILLPQEVDVENSSATAKDGMLTLVLPRLDKTRETKLRVRSG